MPTTTLRQGQKETYDRHPRSTFLHKSEEVNAKTRRRKVAKRECAPEKA